MILLRIIYQLALGSILRSNQHVILEEPVGGLSTLFLVEGSLGFS